MNTSKSFETIFEQSPISTQIFAPNGDTLRVNKAWEKLWGIDFKNMGGYNVLQDHQLVEKGIMPYIRRGFAGETVHIPAIKYVPNETLAVDAVSYRWVSALIYPVRNEKGEIEQVILQHEDITKQKDVEEELKMSEERLRLALDAGVIGVWDWDALNNKITWSEEVYKIHEIDREDFDGTYEQYRTFTHPEDRERTGKAVQEALARKGSYEQEFRILTKSNKVKWIATRASVFYDKDGKPYRMVGATMDITDRKKQEQQKDEFMGIVSHELKTPVTSLKAYGQVLQKQFKTQGNQQAAGMLGKMDNQINKLTTLISDLLDVTKIEAGKLRFDQQKFSLDELVTEVIEEVQRTTDKHKIEQIGKSKKFVHADRDRVGQVLTNFLTNAIKYSPNTKKITVTVSSDKKAASVSVKDRGVGIPKKDLPYVFDRFFRVNSADRQTIPGIGLGLYISAEFIRGQKGKIWVESEEGKGTTFSFSLPISK